MQYVEIRPTRRLQAGNFKCAESFFLHRLDLSPSLETIFARFQKSSIQRSIRRAERLDIKLEQGRSEWHLQAFYKLFVVTRRRLQAPPHPIQWFRNLIAYLGPKINILVAVKDDRPIASIITLHYKQTTTYKYGCSDASRHSLRGMPFLLWKAIEAAKLSGALEFDFGRTDLDNVGLTTFKDRWGARRTTLTYFRYGKLTNRHWSELPGAKIIKRSFAHLPQSLLIRVGNIVYRHIG
jgi:lipid II:glycine glycyltransferase (peptidoglycan interpeptide bridge formation enzyme)